MRWARLAATVACLVFAASACSERSAEPAARDPVVAPAERDDGRTDGSSDGTSVVPNVLDFEAPLLSGDTLDGETLAGRDVAFWFWAPW